MSAEAVALGRELVGLNRDAYLPDLASALNNHANRLAETGLWAEAAVLSEEVVRLRRELIAPEPGCLPARPGQGAE